MGVLRQGAVSGNGKTVRQACAEAGSQRYSVEMDTPRFLDHVLGWHSAGQPLLRRLDLAIGHLWLAATVAADLFGDLSWLCLYFIAGILAHDGQLLEQRRQPFLYRLPHHIQPRLLIRAQT